MPQIIKVLKPALKAIEQPKAEARPGSIPASGSDSAFLAGISPKLHERYSPNLYNWLKGLSHRRHLPQNRVWRCPDDRLWIGWLDDGFLIGARLNGVLCNGRREQTMAYTLKSLGKLTEVADFWPRYMEIGRCAIDVDHTTPFQNSDGRWLVLGDKRQCQWCGQKQTLRRWTETVERSRWESLNAKAEPRHE